MMAAGPFSDFAAAASHVKADFGFTGTGVGAGLRLAQPDINTTAHDAVVMY